MSSLLQFNQTPLQIGLLYFSPAASYLLFALPVGPLTDKIVRQCIAHGVVSNKLSEHKPHFLSCLICLKACSKHILCGAVLWCIFVGRDLNLKGLMKHVHHDIIVFDIMYTAGTPQSLHYLRIICTQPVHFYVWNCESLHGIPVSHNMESLLTICHCSRMVVFFLGMCGSFASFMQAIPLVFVLALFLFIQSYSNLESKNTNWPALHGTSHTSYNSDLMHQDGSI
jgi:hypothetical protein